MKIKRNPALTSPLMFPFLRGVYLGATMDPEASKKAGAPRFAFNDDEIDLGSDAFKRDPRGYAYWVRKVKDGDALAADAEMAAAAGVKLEKSAQMRAFDAAADAVSDAASKLTK